MKTLLILIFFLTASVAGFAQNKKTRAKYRIKVVEKNYVVTRGLFYAAADDGLTVISISGDTVKIAANKIASLFIRRRGIIAPAILIGAGIMAFLTLQLETSGFIDPKSLLLITVPIGVGIGYVVGEFSANRRYYKKLEAKDFPLIKANLQRFTQIKE